MKREPVTSSALLSIGYDPQLEVMEVEFVGGRIYQYFNVPEFLYRGFLLARSKGEYFKTRINERFHSEEVERGH